MKRYQKLIFFSSILLLSGCILNNDEDPTKTITTIELKNMNCTVYLKHVVWGITRDNSITYIGTTASLQDTVREPYFRAIDFFYAMKDDCSLHIYNSDSLYRKHLLGIQIVLDGNDDVNYSNYKKKGFDNILYN